jgi:hypothetical protein
MKIENIQDAMKACKKLHTKGPRVVVISSCFFDLDSEKKKKKKKELIVIGSMVLENGFLYEQYAFHVPFIDSYYTGTGDLFAALLLSWLYRYPNNLKKALEHVLSSIQDVLQTTLRTGGRNCELKLIQSRQCIAVPRIHVFARPLAVPITSILLDLEVLAQTTTNNHSLLWLLLEENKKPLPLPMPVPVQVGTTSTTSNIITTDQLMTSLFETFGHENVGIVSAFDHKWTLKFFSSFCPNVTSSRSRSSRSRSRSNSRIKMLTQEQLVDRESNENPWSFVSNYVEKCFLSCSNRTAFITKSPQVKEKMAFTSNYQVFLLKDKHELVHLTKQIQTNNQQLLCSELSTNVSWNQNAHQT